MHAHTHTYTHTHTHTHTHMHAHMHTHMHMHTKTQRLAGKPTRALSAAQARARTDGGRGAPEVGRARLQLVDVDVLGERRLQQCKATVCLC